MKKYRTTEGEIELVKVDMESSHSIWVDGYRSPKVSRVDSYHETEYQARQHLVCEAKNEVNRAKALVKCMQERLKMARMARCKRSRRFRDN